MFGAECIALWRLGVAKMWWRSSGELLCSASKEWCICGKWGEKCGVDLGFGCRWEAMGSRGLCHVGVGQSIVRIAIWRVLCAECVAMRSRG